MKFFLGMIAAILIIFGGGYLFYSTYYSTEDYYVKITADPEIAKEKADDGYTDITYTYYTTGYDKTGKAKKLKLSSGDQMKKGQYYLIRWENRREIVSSKERVNEREIDQGIVKKLNQQP
ncbi:MULTISPECIES: YxeA family protein [Bacillus]|uniref:YxeA family protein n=3 Tax=Bacillus TaxID=1386 RepID=A0AAJ3YYG4_9BACI|nr:MULTISPECIES: YxeA family protein [Bacillus]KKB74934.1 LicD family protein [Bacillus sp. TH008]MBU8785022.1 YxeA family protein [Bacillus glycinifermentans]MDU0071132.1 YxeA family protein [Bacillus sp. IG6]MED8019000.1 YxeA family protein [Bacillus glycinifermentans]NUJ15197.1 YxeA family protein [Bacillus glycinifermentans]